MRAHRSHARNETHGDDGDRQQPAARGYVHDSIPPAPFYRFRGDASNQRNWPSRFSRLARIASG